MKRKSLPIAILLAFQYAQAFGQPAGHDVPVDLLYGAGGDAKTAMIDEALRKAMEPQGIVVRLQPSATVGGARLRLADIGELSGEDLPMIALLAELDLGPGPEVGKALRLTRPQVERSIEMATGQSSLVRFEGASEIAVERQSMRIDMQLLRQEIVKRLEPQLPFPAEEMVVSDVQLPEEIVLPKGRLRFDIEFGLSRRMFGQTPFEAIFRVDDQVAQRLSGSLKLDRQTVALRASRAIAKGEKLAPGDFQPVSALQSTLPASTLDALPAESRIVASRSIRAGEMLTDIHIERPALVKRNQPVTLLVESGGLRVTATGVTREDASEGQIIRCMNLLSNKEVFAQIVNEQTARVVF